MGRKRRALGEAGSDAAVYQEQGHPLLTALFEGDVEGATQLLQADGCDVEAMDQLGWRPLHRACFGGYDGLVEMLLKRGADATAEDTEGLQPLHVATSGGHLECCRLLLAARADPTVPERYSGMSAQMYAMKDDEASKRLAEVLGAADLMAWATSGDPVERAKYLATVDCETARAALEAAWAEELGAPIDVNVPAMGNEETAELTSLMLGSMGLEASAAAGADAELEPPKVMATSGCTRIVMKAAAGAEVESESSALRFSKFGPAGVDATAAVGADVE